MAAKLPPNFRNEEFSGTRQTNFHTDCTAPTKLHWEWRSTVRCWLQCILFLNFSSEIAEGKRVYRVTRPSHTDENYRFLSNRTSRMPGILALMTSAPGDTRTNDVDIVCHSEPSTCSLSPVDYLPDEITL
ncbi:uncharacterized protein LOC119745202 [Patiria miniata]|uniref:Uncharacterized protein n=1 Tax=Patiria miniata TaxID=46514 RepID=A0A914BPD5_PATMI|nr:uncharacterized protein LOC119745202 [Patiria miniata]